MVVVAGLGAFDPAGEDEIREEARLLYVAMTRSTHDLVMTSHRETGLTRRLAIAIGSVGSVGTA